MAGSAKTISEWRKSVVLFLVVNRSLLTTGVTCDRNTHQEWYSKYSQRFSRLSYPGVRRVIRRQQNSTPGAAPFTLNIEQQLPIWTIYLGTRSATPFEHGQVSILCTDRSMGLWNTNRLGKVLQLGKHTTSPRHHVPHMGKSRKPPTQFYSLR